MTNASHLIFQTIGSQNSHSMNSRTYLNKQLPMLHRASLLSRLFFMIAGLLVVVSLVLPALQKVSEYPAGESVGYWHSLLLQLPLLDKDAVLISCVGVLALVWMAYVLRALVTIAEIQCVDLDE